MKRILITGHLGYVGSAVILQLAKSRPQATLIGLDRGFFAHCLTRREMVPESLMACQFFADMRHIQPHHLERVDGVIHLAAISNDPMGQAFATVTEAINQNATVGLARLAKSLGVASFVLASSCSMYGAAATGEACNEDSPLQPLTAYARSKVAAEQALADLADDSFQCTALRFGTAYGMSHRLRLDLVLNDFVASSLSSGRIQILSDGTPWRPIIHIRDMALAMDWALDRPLNHTPFLAVNVGQNDHNFQVRDLAQEVAACLPQVEVEIHAQAQPDKRSYRVAFDRFQQWAPHHQPRENLATALLELADGLRQIDFQDAQFRTSRWIRLHELNRLRQAGILDEQLYPVAPS